MIVWSLFSGIGGIDLGLERAGMTTVLQVELEEFCQKVLTKHFPNTLKFRDIRQFNDLISSVVGSPARTFQLLENGQDSQEQEADFGVNSSARFAYYDPDTSSWRTYQDCLPLTEDETLGEYSETWPKAGTMRNGKCYLQDSLEPRIYDDGSFLWPTADTHQGGRTLHKCTMVGRTAIRHTGTKAHLALEQAVKMLPTPGSSPAGPDYARKNRPKSGGDSLQTVIGGQLNPTWVEWLMGFPLGSTDFEDSAMPSCPKLPNGSGNES